MVCCCVYGCHNRYGRGSVSFHSFPLDPEMRALWIKAINRKNWAPSPYSKICSDHFLPHDLNKTYKSGKVHLKDGAIPSLFPDVRSLLSQTTFEMMPQIRRSSSPELSHDVHTVLFATPSTEIQKTSEGGDIPRNDEDDLMISTTIIKEDDTDSKDPLNDVHITEDIPQPLSETSEDNHQMDESVSSVSIKYDPLIEFSCHSQPLLKEMKREPADSLQSPKQPYSKLHKCVMIKSTNVIEDEYYYFAMHIACQLRQLPKNSFVILQEKIQNLVSEERLSSLTYPDQTVCTIPSSLAHQSSPS